MLSQYFLEWQIWYSAFQVACPFSEHSTAQTEVMLLCHSLIGQSQIQMYTEYKQPEKQCKQAFQVVVLRCFTSTRSQINFVFTRSTTHARCVLSALTQHQRFTCTVDDHYQYLEHGKEAGEHSPAWSPATAPATSHLSGQRCSDQGDQVER